jgi:monoamine oxidase
MSDVTIVGGGICGLRCAWSLLQRLPGISVTIYTEGVEVGGRLLSVHSMPHGTVDLGAARFCSAHHPHLDALMTRFGLERRVFGYPNRYAHIEHAQRMCAFDEVKFRFDQTSQRILNQKTMRLWDVPFVEAARSHVGSDEFKLLLLLSGYDTLNNSRLPFSEAIRILVGHPENGEQPSPWYAPVGGFQKLAQCLAQEVLRVGGKIQTNHTLSDLRRTSKGFRLNFRTDNSTRTVSTRRVVLAIPGTALKGLDLQATSARVWQAADSVEPVPLFKCFIDYETPWWHSLGVPSSSLIVTGLPMRKIYFESKGRLWFYADGESASWWGQQMSKPRTEFMELCSSMLSSIFAVERAAIPTPLAILERFWPAGVYFWRLGVSPERVHDLLQEDNGLFLRSDCFSHGSGWVEGALTHGSQGWEYLE